MNDRERTYLEQLHEDAKASHAYLDHIGAKGNRENGVSARIQDLIEDLSHQRRVTENLKKQLVDRGREIRILKKRINYPKTLSN